MLWTLEIEQKKDSKKCKYSLVYAYNCYVYQILCLYRKMHDSYKNGLLASELCMPYEATRISPYELMFGRNPKLLIDATFLKLEKEQATRMLKSIYRN